MAGRPEKYVALRKHLEKKGMEFRDSGEDKLPMTFKKIEDLGVRLPPSAYSHRAWWANNQGTGFSNFVRDPTEKPWQRAKFDTADVDMKRAVVTFRYLGGFSHEGQARRAESRARKAEESRTSLARFRQQRAAAAGNTTGAAPVSSILSPGLADLTLPYSLPEKTVSGVPRRCRHPLYGALKGHIRLVAGTDLTKPASPHLGRDKP